MKVAVGCHDQCAAALGAGCVAAGDLVAGEGSAESLNLVVDRSQITEKFYGKNIAMEPYVQPGQYMVPTGQHVHGTSIRWFVQEFGADFGKGKGCAASERNLFELANKNCAEDSGEVFFIPYLSRANLMDADNRALGTFFGLEVDTDRSKMYRALLEGLCFETKLCFDALHATGFPIRKIMAAGGCSKSELLMQMKADVLGRPVRILENVDAGISALAMICAVADDAYGSYAEAEKVFVRTKKEYVPQRDYSEKYEKYRTLLAAAKELYKKI
jgi:xylulokinase